MKILLALLMFGVLIFVHEIGHFIAARAFGVKVNEFALGMGPKIFSYKSQKSGTVYSLRLFPVGGFNDIEGENGDSTDDAAFCTKAVWKRMIIIVSGAALNLLFAVILMAGIVIATDKLGSTVVAAFTSNDSAQGEDAEGSETGTEFVGAVSNTAEKLAVGDKIVKINGKRVHIIDELVYTIAFECVEPADVTVIRNGETTVITDVVFPTYESSGIVFGSIDFSVYREEKNFGSIMKHSWFKCVSSMETIWESLFGLVSGKYGVEHVSGPVGVTDALGDAAESGTLTVLNMVVIISMNLGVFNLLPIPALDGGRLVFLIIEAIRRKPIRHDIEATVHTVGILVLMSIMVLVTFKDVFVIFKK
ncbi:MAG: site-2 protease family protein [Clostridia bacterium]|nr:site-2 protease family protein [Clostridia bacterium]